MSLEAFVKSLKPFNRYSQFGEDGIIQDIFAKIGTANKWCVECGAGDGIFFSNTKKLIDEGWSSIQIEADPKAYEQLRARYAGVEVLADGAESPRPNVWTENVKIGSVGFEDVFSWHSPLPKDFDLLVIDVDGQDYHLWNQLLTYHPRVVICEYDPNADPDFIPEIDGPGQAGMRAIHHVALARGYQVVCATQCNLICVRNDLVELLTREVVTLAPVELDPRYSPLMDAAENAAALESMQPPLGPYSPEPERCEHSQLKSVVKGVAFAGDSALCKCCDNQFGYGGPCGEYCQQCEPIAVEVAHNGNGHSKELKIGAAMSTPRFGPLSTFDCILQALQPFGIPLFRGEGCFWSHSLSRSIQKVLDFGGEYVLTIDYDTIFNASPTNSDIAKLVVLMHDNPDVDVIVPFQMRREGGPLLANTGGEEVRISDRLIPISQGHFGLTLFRASVFERIAKPWFRESPGPDGHWNEGRIDSDIGFWINCKENGVRVALSTDVIIGHGEYVVTWPDEAIKPHYQPLNAWRNTGAKPPEAFDREKFVQAAIEGRAKMEVKLDMGE